MQTHASFSISTAFTFRQVGDLLLPTSARCFLRASRAGSCSLRLQAGAGNCSILSILFQIAYWVNVRAGISSARGMLEQEVLEPDVLLKGGLVSP